MRLSQQSIHTINAYGRYKGQDMKRYLLFTFSDTPYGGWGDYKGSWDEKDVAIQWGESEAWGEPWYHVIDSTTGVIIKRNDLGVTSK